MPCQLVLYSRCGLKDSSHHFFVNDCMEGSEDSHFDYAHDEQADAEFKKEPLPPGVKHKSGQDKRHNTGENED